MLTKKSGCVQLEGRDVWITSVEGEDGGTMSIATLGTDEPIVPDGFARLTTDRLLADDVGRLHGAGMGGSGECGLDVLDAVVTLAVDRTRARVRR
jgi:hypothetical protein